MTILTKILLITSITLMICSESTNAHPPDSCRCDTILPVIEHGYGPPHPPVPHEENTDQNYQEYIKGLEENNKKSDYLYELGYLAMEMGELDNAIEYFELSEKYNNYTVPYYITYLHNWLGDIWEQKGDLEKAKEHYLKRGDIYYIRLIQAKIHEQNGDFNLAVVELFKAQEIELYEMDNKEPFLLLAQLNVRKAYFDWAAYWATKYAAGLEIENLNPETQWVNTQKAIDEAWAFVREIKRQRKEKLGY